MMMEKPCQRAYACKVFRLGYRYVTVMDARTGKRLHRALLTEPLRETLAAMMEKYGARDMNRTREAIEVISQAAWTQANAGLSGASYFGR